MSGGQRQRVALGRAIIRTPRVFLFDEPLSNLDAQLRMHMRSEIVALQKELELLVSMLLMIRPKLWRWAIALLFFIKEFYSKLVSHKIFIMIHKCICSRFLRKPFYEFFHGSFTKIDNELIFQELHNGASFTIPDHSFIYGIPDDKNIIVGIRPEKLSLTHLENAPTWQCSIHQTEYHGHEQIALCNLLIP